MTPSPLPRDDADASLISLADFRLLLAEQHPFSLVLGIEVERIGRGTALAVLPARDLSLIHIFSVSCAKGGCFCTCAQTKLYIDVLYIDV